MPSIIQAIKDAILTEISSDVRIQERSFWSQLLEEKKNDQGSAPWSMQWKVDADKPFIATRFLFRCLYNILLCFIWLCNVIYEFIFRGISGRWRGYSREESKTIRCRDIFKKGIQPSAGINIILAGLALVAGIVTIVYIIVFNINHVVLAPSNLRTNTCGVISIDQPGLETQHYFLLNAANYWAPTGIALSKGDRVYITASGSMYGDIYNLDTCARNNKRPEYSRSIIGPNYLENETDTLNTKYCIYGRNKKLDKKARFGSLLYQVCPSIQAPAPYNGSLKRKEKEVFQINFKKRQNAYRFKSKGNGALYFCFNDILLDATILKKIEADYIRDTSIRDLKKLYKPLLECGWYPDSLKITDSLLFMHDTSSVLIKICSYLENDSNLKKITDTIYTKYIQNPFKKNGWDSIPVSINNSKDVNRWFWFPDTPVFLNTDIDSSGLSLLDTLKKAKWIDITEHDSTIWFQDNLGEVLVNVRVEQNLRHTAIPWQNKILTWWYRRIEHFLRWKWYWELTAVIVLLLAITIGCLEPVMIRGIRKIRGKGSKADSSTGQATEAL